MRRRSVTRNLSKAPKFKKLSTRKIITIQQPKIVKTRRGEYTGDKATDPLEREAWPKGTRYHSKLASLPERRVIWWLLHRSGLTEDEWDFQPDFLGGRAVRGGLVSDFALYTIWPGEIILWEVQGTTWHKAAWKVLKDRERAAMLLNIEGVAAVINLKEADIIRSDHSRDDVCGDALRVIQW